MWRPCLASLSVAILAMGQEPGLHREGSHWVQILTGTIPVTPNSRLRIETRGPVSLQGRAVDQIQYLVKKRVRARSESEARTLLKVAAIQTSTRGSQATIALSRLSRLVSADMELTAPNDLRLADIDTLGGDIQVYDIRGTVHSASEGGVIRMDRIGSSVLARTGGGEIRLGAVGGEIRCYSAGGLIEVDRAGGESWLETAGGDIFVRESGGPVHTITGGGNIQVQHARSTVSAQTAGGRIEILRANGIVLADNSGGSIQVGSSRGVRVASTGGSIRLRGSSGSLRAVTDVGSILAEFMNSSGLQDSILTTGSGDITVYIPSNLPLTIQALNENGRADRIISDFSEILVRKAAEAAREGVVAEGALNGGGPVLRLTSTGGTIYLKRRP